jgi:hypothetical protein
MVDFIRFFESAVQFITMMIILFSYLYVYSYFVRFRTCMSNSSLTCPWQTNEPARGKLNILG